MSLAHTINRARLEQARRIHEASDAGHRMDVLIHTPDVTRLRFSDNGRGLRSYVITILPGQAMISGDQDTFTFANGSRDIADDFASGAGINYEYWAEKCTSSRHPILTHRVDEDVIQEMVRSLRGNLSDRLAAFCTDRDTLLAELDRLTVATDGLTTDSELLWSDPEEFHAVLKGFEHEAHLGSGDTLRLRGCDTHIGEVPETYESWFLASVLRIALAARLWVAVRDTTPRTHVHAWKASA